MGLRERTAVDTGLEAAVLMGGDACAHHGKAWMFMALGTCARPTASGNEG
jgi:hypothetical protein